MTDYRVSHVGDKRGEIYDSRYGEGAEALYWTDFEKPYLQELFRRAHRDNVERHLDFAAGTGRILEVAAPYFRESLGIDVSSDMLEQARKKVPTARLVRADVTTEKIDVGKFGLITIFRFILNAETELREQVLCWLRSVMSDGGILVVNNHLNRHSLTGIACMASNRLRGKRKHNILSDGDVERLLRKCGFVVVEKFGFGVIPGWRNRLLLPRQIVRFVERVVARIPGGQRLGKDRIYVCRAV